VDAVIDGSAFTIPVHGAARPCQTAVLQQGYQIRQPQVMPAVHAGHIRAHLMKTRRAVKGFLPHVPVFVQPGASINPHNLALCHNSL
jgi:hypothetical protein